MAQITPTLLLCLIAACAELSTSEDVAALTTPNFAFDALQFSGAAMGRTTTPISAATDNLTLEAWVRSVLLGGVGWVNCTDCQLTAGAWTHITVVRAAGAWSFFENGSPRTRTGTVLPTGT